MKMYNERWSSNWLQSQLRILTSSFSLVSHEVGVTCTAWSWTCPEIRRAQSWIYSYSKLHCACVMRWSSKAKLQQWLFYSSLFHGVFNAFSALKRPPWWSLLTYPPLQQPKLEEYFLLRWHQWKNIPIKWAPSYRSRRIDHNCHWRQ